MQPSKKMEVSLCIHSCQSIVRLNLKKMVTVIVHEELYNIATDRVKNFSQPCMVMQ